MALCLDGLVRMYFSTRKGVIWSKGRLPAWARKQLQTYLLYFQVLGASWAWVASRYSAARVNKSKASGFIGCCWATSARRISLAAWASFLVVKPLLL